MSLLKWNDLSDRIIIAMTSYNLSFLNSDTFFNIMPSTCLTRQQLHSTNLKVYQIEYNGRNVLDRKIRTMWIQLVKAELCLTT